MICFRSAALCTALALLLGLTGSLYAAPDNTLGMALFSAFVTSNGDLGTASGVKGSARNGTGDYTITFDRDVSNCSYGAMSFGPGALISVVGVGVDGHLNIWTQDTSGTKIDHDFTIIVVCSQ